MSKNSRKKNRFLRNLFCVLKLFLPQIILNTDGRHSLIATRVSCVSPDAMFSCLTPREEYIGRIYLERCEPG